MVGTYLSNTLHIIGQGVRNPCMAVLLLMIIITIQQIGDLLVEYIFERRRMKENSPELLKKLSSSEKEKALQIIRDSRLLKRQKQFAEKMANAQEMSENSLAAYTQNLLSLEDAHYRRILAPTDLISKLGPMFGLLGTLIPLGPGIVALGKGDIKTLSESIGVGFDTTIVGVIVAAICFSISYVRGHWYEGYISTNEAMAESLLDIIIKVQDKSFDLTDKALRIPNKALSAAEKVISLPDEEGVKKRHEKKFYQA